MPNSDTANLLQIVLTYSFVRATMSVKI